MRTLLAAAALLLVSSAAQAQYTFEYGGKTIRIDPDRGTVQIPGVYDNTKKAKKSKNDDAPLAKSKQPETATEAAAAPSPAPPAAQPSATAVAPPAAAPAPAPVAATAAAPIQAPVPPPLAATVDQPATSTAAASTGNPPVTTASPPPAVQQSTVTPPPAAAPSPISPTAAVAPPAAPAPVVAGNSPVGVWLTEEKEGKVRIEQCGTNLCGYSVDKRTNQNGEQVLINMKPGKDKWSGRILDPTTGSTYDSTIAMKGTDTLRVQGCAFGGVFCGGQTWTRVN